MIRAIPAKSVIRDKMTAVKPPVPSVAYDAYLVDVEASVKVAVVSALQTAVSV